MRLLRKDKNVFNTILFPNPEYWQTAEVVDLYRET
jgi:hypothetical protein